MTPRVRTGHLQEVHPSHSWFRTSVQPLNVLSNCILICAGSSSLQPREIPSKMAPSGSQKRFSLSNHAQFTVTSKPPSSSASAIVTIPAESIFPSVKVCLYANFKPAVAYKAPFENKWWHSVFGSKRSPETMFWALPRAPYPRLLPSKGLSTYSRALTSVYNRKSR